MESLFTALDWKQLGVSGLFIGFLIWLYAKEREERRYWQDKSFEAIEAYADRLQQAISTIDQAIRMLKK